MMDDRLPERVRQAPSLRSVYELILRYPGIGPFLAFQYTIDLNYSSMMDFEELRVRCRRTRSARRHLEVLCRYGQT